MKRIPLSPFDIGIIIAFVVIGLLGGGAWYYLSGELATAQQNAADAKADYDKNASNSGIVVAQSNTKTLQANIDLLNAQLDPLIKTKFLPKDNKIQFVEKKDPVAWRHDLDDEVARLTGAAKAQNIKLPPNFYFGFSRYLNKSPEDEQTVVLGKQLLAIDQIANILIKAQVNSIAVIQRTYEENGKGGGGGEGTDPDRFGASAITAPGDAYIAYPFEIEFESSVAGLRKIVDGFVQSPYIFVIRSISVVNTKGASPQMMDLDKMSAPLNGTSSVTGTSPGEVAATTSTRDPQFLFADRPLAVKMRVDLIEWHAPPPPPEK